MGEIFKTASGVKRKLNHPNQKSEKVEAKKCFLVYAFMYSTNWLKTSSKYFSIF